MVNKTSDQVDVLSAAVFAETQESVPEQQHVQHFYSFPMEECVEPLGLLSEAVIDILKEFSKEKRPLTSATLREAFSDREEILSLLHPTLNESTSGSEPPLSPPDKYLDSTPAAESEAPDGSKVESLREVRQTFSTILDSLRPVIRDDYESLFCELQKKLNECESLPSLCLLGEEIGAMIRELINQTIERMEFANDFLVELSKDLYKMEEQLSSYQNYNKETHEISSQFNNDLLSHTEDMHRSLDSGESLQDIRNQITSKLNTISKAIEIKRQSDEVRLREADAKIAELQNNLRTYQQEILQIKERCESLEKEVLLDELMQVNNRRAYELQIREDLRRYHRNGEQFSLVLMDIDQFKRVNDDYGHNAGDKCLKEIAQLIKSCLRQSDFLARYGGEELIAILYGSDATGARNVAEKIRARIEKARFFYHDHIIPVTISLGVTGVTPSDTEPEIPFTRADEAMYQAKQSGRNRVRVVTGLSCSKMSDGNFPTGRSENSSNSGASQMGLNNNGESR